MSDQAPSSKETPHTPIPWTVEESQLSDDNLFFICSEWDGKIAECYTRGHAELICLAVNSHALLVEQVETLKAERDKATEVMRAHWIENTRLSSQQASLVEALTSVLASEVIDDIGGRYVVDFDSPLARQIRAALQQHAEAPK